MPSSPQLLTVSPKKWLLLIILPLLLNKDLSQLKLFEVRLKSSQYITENEVCVGKTTTVGYLAACLTSAGGKVFIINLDSQRNATVFFDSKESTDVVEDAEI